MVGRIIETLDCVAEGADWLARAEPRFALALREVGPLPLRRQPDGFTALLDAITGGPDRPGAAGGGDGR